MGENETTGKQSSFRLKDADGKVVDNSGNSRFGAGGSQSSYTGGGVDNYNTGDTDNYNTGGSADNYNTSGSNDNYNISGGTYNDDTNGAQSYHTAGYAGGTNGGVRPMPPETMNHIDSPKTKRNTPGALKYIIVMVAASNVLFLWFAFTAAKQSGFVKKHQDEYTQCQGEVSNVTSERETRLTTRKVNGKSRTVTEEYYMFNFDITYIYQDTEYTRQCRLRRDTEDGIKNGDTMSFIIRDGALSRSFSEEYDWLWGTVESNMANSKNGAIFIVAFLVFFDLIFGVAIASKG